MHFRKWLVTAGFDEQEIEEKFVPFGQGYQSMSPALRDLESDLLNQKIVHGNHPVLTMCAANAVVTKDPAGSRKLDKAKSRGRIDGLVSLVMARGVAATEVLEPAPEYSRVLRLEPASLGPLAIWGFHNTPTKPFGIGPPWGLIVIKPNQLEPFGEGNPDGFPFNHLLAASDTNLWQKIPGFTWWQLGHQHSPSASNRLPSA